MKAKRQVGERYVAWVRGARSVAARRARAGGWAQRIDPDADDATVRERGPNLVAGCGRDEDSVRTARLSVP